MLGTVSWDGLTLSWLSHIISWKPVSIVFLHELTTSWTSAGWWMASLLKLALSSSLGQKLSGLSPLFTPETHGDFHLTDLTSHNEAWRSSYVPWFTRRDKTSTSQRHSLIFSWAPLPLLPISPCFWSMANPKCGWGKAAPHSHSYEAYTWQ